MIQIKRGAATVATVNPLSSSNMTKAVMGDEQITLVWEAPAFVSYYLGDYITFEGANWTLNKLPTVKKLSSKTWQYNAVFQSTKYELIKAMYLLFDNTDTLPSGEFPLTGTANTFMELLVANLNRVAGSAVWTVGHVIENTDYKNLTFSNEDCLSVLARLASEFDTEYHVHNHIIHLKKISTEREITLQYGSTLYDIERSSVDSSDVVTRLYPFGSTKNLASNYRGGNSPLRLPVANGNYIESNVNLYGIIEQSKTFDDIYPRLSSGGPGVVSGVGNYLEFTDSALDFNINDYLLDGTKAKIRFNTGECAGYDFEIASYNHATKTFVLIPNTQENDFTLPTDDLKPAVSDKYVLLDIIMPPLYLAAAEAELLTRAQEYMSQNSTPKVAYKTTFSAIYAKQNLQNVECGDTVTVYDADMGINEEIRIVKLTKGLTDFWTVQFDLSNTVTATRLQRIEGNLAAVENTVIVTNQRVNRNNLRAYQNTKELREMVFDPDGYFDAQNIKPLSIETSMLSVGAKSQSFQLSSLLQPNYAGNPQVLQWSAGLLTHFTIVDDAIKEWTISQGSITITGGNQTSALYIYARCNRAGSTGDIYLSPVALKFNEGSTYYYFLIGVLHTPISSVRGISLTYGQTTINGQFIKTGVISSIDGATYFNLNTGEIGGNIKFRSTSGALKTVEQAIDEVEVGGRNLILNSDFSKNLDGIQAYTGSSKELDAYGRVVISNSLGSPRAHFNNLSLKADSTYIFQIERWWDDIEQVVWRGSAFNYVLFTELYRESVGLEGGVRIFYSIKLSGDDTGYIQLENSTIANEMRLRYPQLEKGNKATDWSPAPEDVTNAINTAQNAANTANQSVSSLNTYVDGAFKDGVIDSAEAKAIEKYINTVNTEYDNAINSYNVVANNSYLEGTPKTTLINVKVTLAGAKDSLMSAISTAIADGKTTVSEKAAVDAAYSSYKSAFGSYSTALENANKAIQQKLDSLSTDKVNAIEVGGRNYVLDSERERVFSVMEIGKINGFTGGETITLSFESKYVGVDVLSIQILNGGIVYGGTQLLRINVTSPNYTKYSQTITLPASLDNLRLVGWLGSNGTGTGYAKKFKVEKGNKATDWSPAPEDTQKVLDDMSSDNKLTAQEKSVALKEWQAIQGEYTRLSTLATQLGVSNTLSTPYTNLANYINPLLSSMTVTSDIVGSTFRSYFTAYYNASTDLQNALTSKVQSNVSNLKPAGKNYLIGSRTDSLVGWIADGGTMSVVTDPQYGKVVEYSRPAGGGDFMKSFTIDTSELNNTELVYYCIAKPISGTTVFNFGGWQETFTMLNNNSPYRDIGNGWRMYYKVFTAGNSISTGGSFGLNSVGGTWRFHSFGVAKGNTPPSDWDASPKEIDFLKQGYQASTDIEGGVVQTAILLLRNALEQVTAGMSGLGNDNIGMWAGGTYQEALNSIAKIILRKDGSGQLAGGNITWDAAGALELLGKITAGSGKIGGLDIFSNSLKSASMSFSETPVESLASLISPASVSIGYQSIWSASVSNTTAIAYSQSFVIPWDAKIKFRATTGWGVSWPTSEKGKWTVLVKQVGGSTVFIQTGNDALSNQLFEVSVPAGTYVIEVQSKSVSPIPFGESNTASASITGESSSTIYAYGYNFQTKIGNNGFYSFWDALKFLYYNPDTGLVVRGATDIPAGLGGASINSSGGVVSGSQWGKMTIQGNGVSKNGSNYTITHYIGDTNYSLILTPISANVPYFTSKSANTVVVTCAGGFDFVLIRTK